MKNEPSKGLRLSFKKEERLSGKKLIDELFKNDSSFYLYPYKVYHRMIDNMKDVPVQVLITAPKKIFHNATDRNRIKRLTREAYRRNKFILHDSLIRCHQKMMVGFIYSGKKIESFALINEKMIAILSRLSQDILNEKKSL